MVKLSDVVDNGQHTRTHVRHMAFPTHSALLSFHEHTGLFNGNVVNTSRAVVLPLDARDVSQYALFSLFFPHSHDFRVVLFCNKHGLSPSVKAGGYGTGGWAINGDIVIDLSRIHDIDIEPPQADGGGYTSLRDTAQFVDKGKARVGQPVLDLSGPGTKRGFEAEDGSTSGILTSAWLYNTTSAAVTSFLHGPELPPDDSGEEPRRQATNRRRLDIEGNALSISADPLVAGSLPTNSNTISSSSGSDTRSSTRSADADADAGAVATPPTNSTSPASSRSPPAPFEWNEPFDLAPTRPDPFGYLDNDDPPMFGPSLPTSSAAMLGTDAALMAHPLFEAGDIPSHLTRPTPTHTHAYVSFGAGAKQKDVDTFTAAQPLDDGDVQLVPYHVPLCVVVILVA